MKRYNSTLIKMTRRLGMAIAALLMLSTMASCSDQDSQAPATGDEAYLNLSFSTASNTTSRASRAGDIGNNETPADPTAESDIHSIKVWVFKSGTGEKANPIAYKEDRPTADGGGTVNGTYTLNLRFLRKINGEELEKIDLYILANSESTNMAEKLKGKDLRSITRADLQVVTFDDPFGITTDGKAQTTKVPESLGLPISRAITNIEIADHVADTEIEAKGGKAQMYQCDVSDMTACGEMIAELIKDYGRIDILVNNAGITRDNLLMRMSEEEFDEVIRVNLKGCFNTMKHVSRYMLKQKGGRIINISSVTGLIGNAGQANYCASKAGVIGLTKSAARELGSRGITVNAIAPGFIETEMTAVLSEKLKETMTEQTLLKRTGSAKEVAAVAAFLASEDASYITGQVISVDGGMAL